VVWVSVLMRVPYALARIMFMFMGDIDGVDVVMFMVTGDQGASSGGWLLWCAGIRPAVAAEAKQ